MAGTITELVVFMASPSDLAEERQAIRSVVEETNAILAASAIRFRVAGWENTLPAAGRPQALINPEVEGCDLFIGVLNRRWGSPTGVYSSGFEEEYVLAQDRHDRTGAPAMHLFFAQVDPSLLADPGVSLQKVIAFKNKITAERRALYRQFDGPHDLARQVQTVLFDKAFRLAESDPNLELGSTSPSDPAVVPATTASTTSTAAQGEIDAAREQMAEALSSLTAVVRGDPRGDQHDDLRLDQDRIELIGRAFGKDQEVLTGHFVNRLYQRRDELQLSMGEGRLWLRSLLADIGRNEPSDRTVPGWAALASEQPTELGELVELAASHELAVAVGATRALVEHDLRPPALFPVTPPSEAQPAETASPTPSAVDPGPAAHRGEGLSADKAVHRRWVDVLNADPGVSEALNFFLSTVDLTSELATLVAQSEELGDNTKKIVRAAQAAGAGDPTLLASEIVVAMFPSVRTTRLRALIINQLAALDDSALAQLALRAEGADLRPAVVELAISRGILTPDAARKAVDWDNDAHVERLVNLAVANPNIVTMLSGDGSRTGATHLRARVLARTQTRVDLQQALVAKPWDAEITEALYLVGGPEALAAARDLIDTEGVRQRELLRPQVDDRDELVEFVVGRNLSLAGQFVARRLAESPDTGDDRLPDLHRVIAAWRAAHRTEQLSFIHAIDAAVRWDIPREVEIARAWLADIVEDLYVAEREAIFDSSMASILADIAKSSTDKTLRTAAKRWRVGQPTIGDDDLVAALYDDDSETRMTALRNLFSRWSRAKLSSLLDTYAQRGGQYWYNVIAALDDNLYAPMP